MNFPKLPSLLFSLGAFAAAFGSASTMAQPRPDESDLERRIGERVLQAMPEWRREILDARPGPDWTVDKNIQSAARAFDEDLSNLRELPADAEQVPTKSGVIRFDRDEGTLRYVNRERAWELDRHRGTRAVDVTRAQSLALDAAAKLGLPRQEFGRILVDTQMAAGAKAGSVRIEETFEMYRLVTVPRAIGNLPVYGSLFRAAVNNEGAVQRVGVAWPAFRLAPDLALLDRKAVAARAAARIVAQSPQLDADIKAQLAYAPAEGEEDDPSFAPVVVISVYAQPTPYQIVVPVADSKRRR